MIYYPARNDLLRTIFQKRQKKQQQLRAISIHQIKPIHFLRLNVKLSFLRAGSGYPSLIIQAAAAEGGGMMAKEEMGILASKSVHI